MTGWYLVWIIVVRIGYDFTITPNEQLMSGIEACVRSEIQLEIDLMDNTVEWADGYSFSISCQYRKEQDEPNNAAKP